ncbi:hypothetical protein K523DRAFT_349967 [Schizophyllum commune Tattone D]|nr:hypothetical protein K523DRAFT_349967 [Schizophyllum commune Tattone D]
MPQNTQHELRRSYAGRMLSHRDGSRAANADASGSGPATLEDELILEEQRREALTRVPVSKEIGSPFFQSAPCLLSDLDESSEEAPRHLTKMFDPNATD